MRLFLGKVKTKCIIALLVALTLVTGLAGCGVSGSTDETAADKEISKVSLCEVTHSVFYAPQYVAMAKGFFLDEGLEIELTNGQGADKVMAAVLSGNTDIGFAGPEAAIYVYNQGKDDYIQVFSQMTQRDGSFLVAREKDDNFTWDKLQGKTILPGRKGGVPYMTLEYVLRQNGIDPYKDATLDNSIQFALMAGAFTSGTGDYVTLFEPTASSLEREGKGYIVASVGQEAGEIPYTAYFAKKSYIENNSDIIEAFAKANQKGLSWVDTHNADEIAEVISPYFPDTDISDLTKSVERYKTICAWVKTGVLSVESFELLQDVMQQAGELENRAPYEKIIDNSFAEKAAGELKN